MNHIWKGLMLCMVLIINVLLSPFIFALYFAEIMFKDNCPLCDKIDAWNTRLIQRIRNL
jgi:disulfide bond formation protein DsbB